MQEIVKHPGKNKKELSGPYSLQHLTWTICHLWTCKTKQTKKTWQDTFPCIFSHPFGVCSLLFLWWRGSCFFFFLWGDWMGRRRDAVQLSIISFKSVVLPQKKVAFFSWNAAIFIFKLQHALFFSHLFRDINCFFKQYGLSWREHLAFSAEHAVFIETSTNLETVWYTVQYTFQCPVLPQKILQCFKELHSLINHVSCTEWMCLS